MKSSLKRSDRGATMVEYALIVGLVVVALVASLKYVETGASSKLSDRGASIGHPDEGGTTTTTSTKPGPGNTTTSTSTTSPYSVITQGSCTGTPSRNSCTFTLDPPADGATTVQWMITPATGVNGDLPGPVTLTVTGKFTIQATVNQVNTSPLVVNCVSKGGSGNIDCTPQ